MKRKLTCIFILLLPGFTKRFFLNLLGHDISAGARIGFSIVLVNKITLAAGARIGSFNLIRVNTLTIGENSIIDKRNRINGNLHIEMGKGSFIKVSNSVYRPPDIETYGTGYLKIGDGSGFTHKHGIDCCRSITLGENTVIAGSQTQFWTHGYFHARTGPERIRVDGEIIIGNNVYIGSRCTFNPGVKISDGVTVGAHCCISKDLTVPGMYVSQELRYIDTDLAKVTAQLKRVNKDGLPDIVYEKNVR